MDLNFHVAPNVRTVSQLLGGYGATVEWWLNMAWNPVAGVDSAVQADRYDELDRTLRDSEIGAHDLLFLPLGGSSQLAAKKSLGGFVGLRLDHSRADMARAILEGIAFEVRWTLDTMAASGLYAEQLWMSGGATRSPVWPGLLADVTGIPLLIADGANWPARGAALLAALGCGICPTVEEAAGLWPASLERIEPDESTRRLYDDHYRAYRTMVRRTLSAPTGRGRPLNPDRKGGRVPNPDRKGGGHAPCLFHHLPHIGTRLHGDAVEDESDASEPSA